MSRMDRVYCLLLGHALLQLATAVVIRDAPVGVSDHSPVRMSWRLTQARRTDLLDPLSLVRVGG